jgi:hypothetical protein
LGGFPPSKRPRGNGRDRRETVNAYLEKLGSPYR